MNFNLIESPDTSSVIKLEKAFKMVIDDCIPQPSKPALTPQLPLI